MEAQSLPHGRGISLPRSRRLLAALGDERLVEQVRRGNDAAFEVIFDRYHRGILSFCRHMLASVEEAEDAVQHTFIQAYDSMRRSPRELKLKAWLYAIARNRCVSVLRARREQAAELQEIPTEGLSDAVQERAELREMLADVRELPEEQRAALVLSEIGDLSHAEIATVVGCEPNKVKSLVFQARSSLIESRNAREVPCHEIREQLATASGGELRRGTLRRHVKQCAGCAEFRDAVKKQRRALAALIPVAPSAALQQAVIGTASVGALSKTVAIIAATGVAVGGGVAVTETATHHDKRPAQPGAAAAARPTPAVSAAPTGNAARPAATHVKPATPRAHGAAPQRRSHHGVKAHANPPKNHGTATAPGLNGTAGAQGRANGHTKQPHTNNGNHNGLANGHGVKARGPKQVKPDKPDKPVRAPLGAGPPADLPGRRVGNKQDD